MVFITLESMKTRQLACVVSLLALAIALVPFFACNDENYGDTDVIGVIVTILPQQEFVSQVGGGKVDITVMVPPGADAHTYEPTPSQMVSVAKADMYAKVGSGVEFELAWMGKLADQNKDMEIIDCSKDIKLIEMGAVHEHEGEGEDHGGMDPHIWMSPKNAIVMVKNICDGLVKIDPENKSYYESNRDAYLAQLSQLDQEMESGLVGVNNRVFMVYHPAFGYLAHDYDLTMLAVEEEGKEPSASGLVHLIEQANEYDIKVIFVEPQFNTDNAKTIADEIGGEVVLIDPLAKNYISNMQSILNSLIENMG